MALFLTTDIILIFMMKGLFFLVFSFGWLTLSGFRTIQSADDLDMETLIQIGKETGYTDHIPHFNLIFENYPVKDFLEFGLGFSTKYFLDHCQKVISVEFITCEAKPDWMKECLRLYGRYPHWIPIAYFSRFSGDTSWAPSSVFGSANIYLASKFQWEKQENYALKNRSYLDELNTFISTLFSEYQIDVAFVDAGIFIRGDLVQLLFNKVPIILAHDARCRGNNEKLDYYGYHRISPPENYEEFFIDIGMGTIAWIKKGPEFTQLRDTLKQYVLNPLLLNGN